MHRQIDRSVTVAAIAAMGLLGSNGFGRLNTLRAQEAQGRAAAAASSVGLYTQTFNPEGVATGAAGVPAVTTVASSGTAVWVPAEQPVTGAAGGLVINPIFDSSITNDANAAAIMSAVNTAIANVQAAFSDPITVTINFAKGGGLGSSSTYYSNGTYASYLAALKADATTSDDATAISLLPSVSTNPVNGSASINVKLATLRAVGVVVNPPAGQPDGFITLNTALTTPGSPGSSLQYNLTVVAEHEIDEVIGLSSSLPGIPSGTIFPEDLYRYNQNGARTFTATDSRTSLNYAYFSLDGSTKLAEFDNQNDGGDFGDWQSNPRRAGVATKVQDAFATVGAAPDLSVELQALDVIGYNRVASVAAGAITNGATHTGVIEIGGLDTWTITAAVNDSITIRIGAVTGGGADPTFVPRIRLIGPPPTSASLGDDYGSNAAEIEVRATLTGTYTVLVSQSQFTVQTGTGNYALTVAKTPGPYTVSPGDEGGAVTNGATRVGLIPVGDLDVWTIVAAVNDSITIRVGEVTGGGLDPNFVPRIRLRGPDGAGAPFADDYGSNAAEIEARATVAGTYTVLVSQSLYTVQTGTGSYVLTVAKTPGPYTVSPGDEGGPITNGATHTGLIPVGDLDVWTIVAAVNDSITVRIGEVTGGGLDPNFVPRIRLRGPDGAGAPFADDYGSNVAEVEARATVAGTYTVLVSQSLYTAQTGTGSYVLTVAKTPGPYTVSPGDEGGPITNGALYPGAIPVGDMDVWTIVAAVNDSITVRIGEVTGGGLDPNFVPRIRLRGPDGAGAPFADNYGSNAAEIEGRATVAGTYTVLVSQSLYTAQTGTGSYVLTVAKTPGPYAVSLGDEGGPVTNGATHTGLIPVGDLDVWTIVAAVNDSIAVRVGEVTGGGADPNFVPRIRLRGPDGAGAPFADDYGSTAAEIETRATVAGTYTVLVSQSLYTAQTGTGSYVLTVAKTPGPYAVSLGDEGGPVTNGATHTGLIRVGDLDVWTIVAAANDSITVRVGEVTGGGADPNFVPRIRLRGPDGAGAPFADDYGANAAEIDTHATVAGTYTVLVSQSLYTVQTGTGSYTLTGTGSWRPAPPIDLTAAGAGFSRIRLTWTGSDGAASYIVKRSTVPGAETTIATGVTGTLYDDTAIVRGQRYYYVIAPVNIAGAGVNSNEASAATPVKPTTGDFDGDGKVDVTVFRQSNGTWYIRQSSTNGGAFIPWGLPGDIPVPGDYDGDGRSDAAVYRPSTGIWYIQNSTNSSLAFLQWGIPGDIPTAGDFDGDGKFDAAVFRPSTGIWYVRDFVTNTASFYQWGLNGDIPVAGDYDGDGKTDVAVFRPSTGIWYVRNSKDGSLSFLQWGITGDVPVPGDYNGDGKSDAAVFRPSTNIWYVRDLATNQPLFYQWGLPGDIEVPGDYDGDNKTDVAVFRPSTGFFYIWFVGNSTFAYYSWGLSDDLPVLRRQ